MKNTEKDLVAEKAIAETKAFDAKVKLGQKNAEVKKTKSELKTASGIGEAKRRVKEEVTNVKAYAAADRQQTKADFKQAKNRFAALDAAATRDFEARLDAAEAQLAAWKAQANVDRADERIMRHDDVATLEESISLARASAAEARAERHTAKALVALEDAAVAFDEAYDAAAKRYNP